MDLAAYGAQQLGASTASTRRKSVAARCEWAVDGVVQRSWARVAVFFGCLAAQRQNSIRYRVALSVWYTLYLGGRRSGGTVTMAGVRALAALLERTRPGITIDKRTRPAPAADESATRVNRVLAQ